MENKMDSGWALLLLAVIVAAILGCISPGKEGEEKSSEVRTLEQYGSLSSAMICPHCQTRGKIRTKFINPKKGVSGGKATAALLTGGVSLLATGLSRKENVTQAHCGECSNTWIF